MQTAKKKSGIRSFFGGPVSTREKCKAAMNDCNHKSLGAGRGEKAPSREKSMASAVPKESLQRPRHIMDVSQRKTPFPKRTGTLQMKTTERSIHKKIDSQLHSIKEGKITKVPKKGQGIHVDGRGRTRLKMRQANAVATVLPKERITKRSTLPMTTPQPQQQQKKKTQPLPMTASGPKKRKVMTSEALPSPQKKAAKIEMPRPSVHESFFDRMRRSTQSTLPNTHRRRVAVPVVRRVVDDEMADFIDDDDEDDVCDDEHDWKAELRKTTGYIPTKFKDDFADVDKSMESSLRDCWREERRSLQIGKLEDQREFERERKRKETKER